MIRIIVEINNFIDKNTTGSFLLIDLSPGIKI